MTLKNILVSYNAFGAADAALATGCRLARKYEAHLTGLLSWGPSRISAALGPWVTDELIASMRAAEATRRAEIAAKFHENTRELSRAQPGKVHWLDLGGDADESLMEAARVYDLVVMGQFASDDETAHLAPHPDLVALKSGRPVLIVPKGYAPERPVDRAILAWDGGRAAARAMSDAMAVLETKSHVTVFSAGDAPQAQRREGLDVVAHLARHGIHTDWKHVAKPSGGVAKAIRDVIAEKNAGLLVMGAYEHPKLLEDLVGGATKSMLSKLDVPVLMSH